MTKNCLGCGACPWGSSVMDTPHLWAGANCAPSPPCAYTGTAEPCGLLMLMFQASFPICLTYLGVSNLEEILMLIV